MDNGIYYNPSPLLSYNRVLSFVIGARGFGKTYGFKKYAINRFLKHGEQFIYLRRYKTDIKGVDQFFDSVSVEFPDNTFRVKGHELYIDDKLCGWVMALSSWQSIKSREFPKVGTILYDEFLLEKSSKQMYMSEEPKALLNFMDTVIRNRTNVRCICMANSVTIVNPFFIYFNIVPDVSKRFNVNESVVVEIADSKGFTDERLKTPFGRLIRETEYGKFSLDNQFVGDSSVFLDKRTKESTFVYSFVYNGMTFGVWLDSGLGILYVCNEYDPSTKKHFAMTVDDMDTGSYMMVNWKKNYYLFKTVKAFLNGFLRFDNQVVRNTCYEMFKKMNIQ